MFVNSVEYTTYNGGSKTKYRLMLLLLTLNHVLKMNTKTLAAAQYIFASLSGCCTSRIFKGCLQSNCINLPLLHHLIRSQMGLPSVVCVHAYCQKEFVKSIQ